MRTLWISNTLIRFGYSGPLNTHSHNRQGGCFRAAGRVGRRVPVHLTWPGNCWRRVRSLYLRQFIHNSGLHSMGWAVFETLSVSARRSHCVRLYGWPLGPSTSGSRTLIGPLDLRADVAPLLPSASSSKAQNDICKYTSLNTTLPILHLLA